MIGQGTVYMYCTTLSTPRQEHLKFEQTLLPRVDVLAEEAPCLVPYLLTSLTPHIASV